VYVPVVFRTLWSAVEVPLHLFDIVDLEEAELSFPILEGLVQFDVTALDCRGGCGHARGGGCDGYSIVSKQRRVTRA
jgi:hypothetical protein